jgi:hypothetical protein
MINVYIFALICALRLTQHLTEHFTHYTILASMIFG